MWVPSTVPDAPRPHKAGCIPGVSASGTLSGMTHPSGSPETPSPDLRRVDLTKIGEDRYKATNDRGGVLPMGRGEDPDFTPVELLLAAIAGCSGIDVDLITRKRAAATSFEVHAEGRKIRDDQGNRLVDMKLTFEVRFPDGEAGDRARAMLPRAISQSRDRLCIVGRTIQVGGPIEYVGA